MAQTSTPLTLLFSKTQQVEVFGTTGARRSPGKVTQCCAGKYVTTAVIAAAQDPADVEMVYKKAVQADAFNSEVLRELETFFAAYDQWGRGDAIKVTECRGGGRGGRMEREEGRTRVCASGPRILGLEPRHLTLISYLPVAHPVLTFTLACVCGVFPAVDARPVPGTCPCLPMTATTLLPRLGLPIVQGWLPVRNLRNETCERVVWYAIP